MEVRRMNMNMKMGYGGATDWRMRPEYDNRSSRKGKREKTGSKSKNCFSVESVLVLVGLAASLLILPVVLPPLPPPPLMLLLLPIIILGGLMVFAFRPSMLLSSARHKGMV